MSRTTHPTHQTAIRRKAWHFAGIYMLAPFLLITGCATADIPVAAGSPPAGFDRAPWNRLVLDTITIMPEAGGYATNRRALEALVNSIQTEGARVRVDPAGAVPSFCSSGTYLLFVKMVERLAKAGQLRLTPEAADRLRVARQPDGVGVWGRWNANGPGVARLFHETGLGVNFESYELARPGDFMKIFWTDEIGSREFGHLVIFQGVFVRDGVEVVRFWSSNQPDGYGSKEVPRERVRWAVFSRLMDPQGIDRLPEPRHKDDFLADMLKRPFTKDEVRHMTGMFGAPTRRSGAASIPASGTPAAITSVPPGSGNDAPPQVYTTHEVKSGETLAGIARRYQSTAAVLAQINGITNVHHIEAGRILRVPVAAPAAAP